MGTIGPLQYEEALSLRKRIEADPSDEEALNALHQALDVESWWEAFDVIAVGEEDIEALINYAILDHMSLALRGLRGLERSLPEGHRLLEVFALASTKYAAKRRRAVKNIIASMREHTQKSEEG